VNDPHSFLYFELNIGVGLGLNPVPAFRGLKLLSVCPCYGYWNQKLLYRH